MLSNWLVAVLGAALAYSIWNRQGLKLHLAVGRVRPAADSPAEELPELVLRTSPAGIAIFEGDAIDVAVGLRPVRGAHGPAWVSGDVGGRPLAFATGLVPPSGWTRTQPLAELRRGPVGASGWKIGTGDPMGLFRGIRRCPAVEVALVLPRFMSLAANRRPRELEAATSAPRAGSGSEPFGVREYRAGDSLRRIHWRASARHGELVVREYEPPGLQTLAVWLDPAPPSREVADQIARIAASEAWDCLREAGRVSLWAPGLEGAPPTRDLWTVLEWLARYPNLPSAGDGTVPTGRGEELVVVTGSSNPELLEAAGLSRRWRGWVVGDAAVAADVELERAGTEWPL